MMGRPIRECVAFPLMRPEKIDSCSKGICKECGEECFVYSNKKGDGTRGICANCLNKEKSDKKKVKK